MVAADRGGVFRILENAGNFTPEEVATALELIDEWLELGEHSGYLTYVLEAQGEADAEVLGYVCFGPTPLTESTYDLYWIAVDKSKHRGGVGKRLMKFAEEEIARRGGKYVAGGDVVAGDLRWDDPVLREDRLRAGREDPGLLQVGRRQADFHEARVGAGGCHPQGGRIGSGGGAGRGA